MKPVVVVVSGSVSVGVVSPDVLAFKTMASILAVAPAGFLLLIGLADPSMVAPLVTTPIGWLCLTAGIGLDACGFWWMRRLVAGIDR